MDSDDNQVLLINFWGDEVNTEQTNPDFLFAAIMPIVVGFLINIQSKDQGQMKPAFHRW